MADANSPRLEDRIKVVVYAVLIAVVMPALAYVWSSVQAVERDLSAYKTAAAERFVSYDRNSQEHNELKAMLRELRDELREEVRQSTGAHERRTP